MPEKKYAMCCVNISHAPLDKLFCYIVPDEAKIQVGTRVWVRFGKLRTPTCAYVIEFASGPPADVDETKLREILSPIDDFAALNDDIIQLVRWMHKKYYTTLLKCILAALPTANPNGKFPISRKPPRTYEKTKSDVTLTPAQAQVVAEITALCENPTHPYLLFGITGSGKTEVYLHSITHVLAQGKSAIMLVPEISLTPQMVALFGARFGDVVCLTHSHMSAGERFSAWLAAREGRAGVCIGPRSAVFAPLKNIGLIIIDEEHEHTYHSEVSPKYDARAIAIKRAKLCGAAVVFGSATPSLKAYLRATSENPAYAIGRLDTRINRVLPSIEIVDMRKEARDGNMSIFSHELQDALQDVIKQGKQAILFLNRRGFASFVSCAWCGNVYSCSRCRVNFTYHTSGHILLCHMCGERESMPNTCSICDKEYIRSSGLGTQKVQTELEKLYPNIISLRMDYDTTRKKNSHEKILSAFRDCNAQVLIGTQMVAKGLDFPGVTLVGVILADMGLYTNDFRSCEHTFTLLTQVAGRAGRSKNPGRVLIQTYSPHNYAIQLAAHGTYQDFYSREIRLRRAMDYPPFTNIFCTMLTGPIERDVIHALGLLGEIMRYTNERDGKSRFEIIGLSPAFVSKLKDQYRWKILVKCKDASTLVKFVLYCVKKLREVATLDGIMVQLSLNPVTMD